MCYSAQIERDYGRYLRVVGPQNALNKEDFVRKYWERQNDFPSMKIPKFVDAWFKHPQTDQEAKVAEAISLYNANRISTIEQELFKQKKRLADAERKLQTKTTKAALKDQEIAPKKIAQCLGWLEDIKRTEFKTRDSYIFPDYYAPVIVMEEGKKTIKLMRYQCRPAGTPKFLDKDLTTFNARRDNLSGKFWKPLFGYSHGILIINSFFEKVSKAKLEGRELKPGEEDPSVTLQFYPQPQQVMYIACLWSHWKEGDEELDSFAAITDDPPPEVLAAGHDRVIIPIKEENIDAWLNPDPKNLDAMQAILEDRARPYYEHRMAA